MLKIPLLPYHMQVLGGEYKPSSKFLYLNSNVNKDGIDFLRPLGDKMNNIIDSVFVNNTWTNPTQEATMQLILQKHRSEELHRQFKPHSIKFSDISKLTTGRRFYSISNSHEIRQMKDIDSVDDEAILIASMK